MSASSGEKPPIVETCPDPAPQDVTLSALEQRIRQQEILSELGVIALQGATIDQLLKDTARLAAEGLQAQFSKVLEYIPAENRLLVRAGVGWGSDVVGVASVGADLASPAGFALKTGKPVISNHLANEQRFRTSELLADYGITRAINVILQGDGQPFGVLELDSRSEVDFTENDIAFLQGAANIVGMAIEREHYQRKLHAALERRQTLLKEMNHRIKNSLTIIVSLFRLQAKAIGNPELTEGLEEAAHRVKAIARAHERLYQNDDIEHLDIGRYIEQVCCDLDETDARCDIQIEAQHGILIDTDRGISLALVVNELVTNAAKYAYTNNPAEKYGFALRAKLMMLCWCRCAMKVWGFPQILILAGVRVWACASSLLSHNS
jgi:GAF domain-containing protein